MTTIAAKTTLDHVTATGQQVNDHRIRNLASKAGRFLWHLVQMIFVMEAGMMVYHKLIMPLLAPMGFHTFMRAHPLVCYWIMVASMTLPMLALMRCYHKSTWRHSLSMTGVMLAPLAAVTVLVLCDLCSIHILHGFGDPLMFLAMALFLLYRPIQHVHSGPIYADHVH